MPMFGADIAALRGLAWSLRRKRQEIDESRRRLAAIVDSLPWTGVDHDRFVDEWRWVHGPALMAIATELSQASSQATYHADRQEQASRRRA
ncbi:MAG: hypothetical protein R8G01_15730 [Ilumatobacteraceae bacterium]|nr:hypothetical protein [Ilumatobacteraceae bacterium]